MNEHPPIIVRRRGGFLLAKTPLDAEFLADFPEGVDLTITVTAKGRSRPMLRLYWALVQRVAEAIDHHRDVVHGLIKLRTGFAAEIKTKRGVERVPGSIALKAMDQPTFQAFFDKAKAFVCEQVLPGVNSEDLNREVVSLLGEEAEATLSSFNHGSSREVRSDAASRREPA